MALRYGCAGDINDAIEIGANHRLEPLRAQLLERRNIAEPGVINDHVETPKRVKCYLHGGVSRAFIRLSMSLTFSWVTSATLNTLVELIAT